MTYRWAHEHHSTIEYHKQLNKDMMHTRKCQIHLGNTQQSCCKRNFRLIHTKLVCLQPYQLKERGEKKVPESVPKESHHETVQETCIRNRSSICRIIKIQHKFEPPDRSLTNASNIQDQDKRGPYHQNDFIKTNEQRVLSFLASKFYS